MKNAVFWDVAPCRHFVNRRFGGSYRFNLQVIRILHRIWLFSVIRKTRKIPPLGFRKHREGRKSRKRFNVVPFVNFLLFCVPSIANKETHHVDVSSILFGKYMSPNAATLGDVSLASSVHLIRNYL
jgi:hypothetical protein